MGQGCINHRWSGDARLVRDLDLRGFSGQSGDMAWWLNTSSAGPERRRRQRRQWRRLGQSLQIAQGAIQAQAAIIATIGSRGRLVWIMVHHCAIMLMVCDIMLLVIPAGHGLGAMQQWQGRAGKQQCQGSKPCSETGPDAHHAAA